MAFAMQSVSILLPSVCRLEWWGEGNRFRRHGKRRLLSWNTSSCFPVYRLSLLQAPFSGDWQPGPAKWQVCSWRRGHQSVWLGSHFQTPFVTYKFNQLTVPRDLCLKGLEGHHQSASRTNKLQLKCGIFAHNSTSWKLLVSIAHH